MNPQIIRDHNGILILKVWRNDKSELHNEKGPAVIYYYEDGKIELEKYYINNKLHNESSPSVIVYRRSGTIRDKFYHLYGEPFNSLKELQGYSKTLILI